jgi:hypothetical protein
MTDDDNGDSPSLVVMTVGFRVAGADQGAIGKPMASRPDHFRGSTESGEFGGVVF